MAGSAPAAMTDTPSAGAAVWEEAQWLPCRLSVEIPVPVFTVRDLLCLDVGSIVDSRNASSADVPLRVNSELIGWAEFEVVGNRMAIRLTALA